MTHRDRNNGHETQEAHDALDRMLAEANELISAPSRLEKNVSRAIGRSIVIRRVATVSSVATIVLVASVLVQTLPGPSNQVQPGGPQAGTNDGLSPSLDDLTPSVPVVHRAAIVYSEPGSKFFGQAIPTSKPNVTLVRIYRDLMPAREIESTPDDAGDDLRDENTDNLGHSPDRSLDNGPDRIGQPGATGPASESNETIIRSEA